MRTTNAAFDLAIDGPGFFRIQTPGGQRFTRDGHFRLDKTSRSPTSRRGRFWARRRGHHRPTKRPVEIARDGSISQGIEQVGRVDVVTFDSLSVLEKVGDNQFRRHLQRPTPAWPQDPWSARACWQAEC
jgi:flagellar basal-body rod protein FlgF